jgi:hypothetical protein
MEEDVRIIMYTLNVIDKNTKQLLKDGVLVAIIESPQNWRFTLSAWIADDDPFWDTYED